jgi:hypothetical protein
MKSSNTQTVNHLSSYEVKTNTIDLTTVEINKNNKGYLVDEKLIDILLSKLTVVDFETFKQNLLSQLQGAKNLEQLTEQFTEGVYLQTVVQKLHSAVETTNERPKVIGRVELDYSAND